MEDGTRIMGLTEEGKLFTYKLDEEEIAGFITAFDEQHAEIFFLLTDEEFDEYVSTAPVNNLKKDFIWFSPKLQGLSTMQCTCGHFLEAGHSMDRLAKQAVKHARRTGHELNPRGN